MSVRIYVATKSTPSPSVLNNLKTLLSEMLKDLSCTRRVRVILVGARRARDLNRRFLGRDYTPDVLTFPLGDEVEIYINLDFLRRTRNFREMLGFYAIHGLLHGCGFTHHGDRDSGEMEHLEQVWFARWKAFLPS